MPAPFVSLETLNLSDAPAPARWGGEAQRLERALLDRMKGEVRFDDGSRALYATDSSNYRQVPIGVVIPRNVEDVIETVALCREFGAPVLARGGGTSLAGQCCNVAVVMDFSKYMNRIVEINADEQWARVQPGVVLDQLRKATIKVGLTFGPDPATHNHCTLGGMIGNNSCGVHSVMAGRTSENVIELDILTYDGLLMTVGPTSEANLETLMREPGRKGEIYRGLKSLREQYGQLVRERYPKIPRRVSGYNLDDLFPENGCNVAQALVGSECTCVLVLEAKVRLVKNPSARSLLVLGYPDVYSAGDHIPEVMSAGPIGCEGVDDYLANAIKRKNPRITERNLLPKGEGWLLVEFGGESQEEADRKARGLMDELKLRADAPEMKLYTHKRETAMVWEIRESALGATAFAPGKPVTWEGWEDAAVAPEHVGHYLRDFRNLLNAYGYVGALYGHFGEGCIHTRINFDLTSAEGIARYHRFIDEAADLVLKYGGSLSGEHGDGQSRAELLPKMFGRELVEAFQQFKSIWDPQWMMNPGKVVKAYRPVDNLRLGADYKPWAPETHFKYPEDEGSFARATLRCVGVGNCRRHEAKTMCPSFRVTGEEMHSTRGRAHLLFELTKEDVLRDGWSDPHVKESLDLCLACKGCKSDCPVNVDLATLKAEFMAHYYEAHPRPRHAYAFGMIDVWASLASRIPGLANLVTQTPGLSSMAKYIAGIPQQRDIPPFAPQTFKEWFFARESRNVGGPPVLLWPDTFNNYFLPDTAKAAVEVLESGGFHVVVPRERLCCGRPLYDHGMLDRAKRYLLKILDTLEAEIAAGVPIVGLEPSCVSVFRDELCNLFPDDERARRMKSQTYLFCEFLDKEKDRFNLPKLDAKAFVQGHCHHKSLFKMETEEHVLQALGVEYDLPDNGCCGLAGSFGFEAEKYDVSMQIAEHELVPHLRSAEKSTIIIADGFSCREQIAHTSERHALHLAEVVRLAQRGAPAGDLPESASVARHKSSVWRSMLRAGIGLGLSLAAVGLWLLFLKRS